MIKKNYFILIMALLAFVSSYAQELHDRTLSLIPYPVSIMEGEGEFVFNDKKVSTDLFAGRGNLETLRVEKGSVDKIVLLGGNNTIIYTLTKVNNVKRVASLKNGEHADLDEIRQYAETQN